MLHVYVNYQEGMASKVICYLEDQRSYANI